MTDEQMDMRMPEAPTTMPAPENTREKAQPKPRQTRGKRVEVVKVRSKRRNKYHPYQKVTITETEWIELPLDNWLEVQIRANVLEKASK